MSRKNGPSLGGITQSQKNYQCPDCGDIGGGNRFLQFHVKDRQCGGKGVTNYYARKFNNRLKNLF